VSSWPRSAWEAAAGAAADAFLDGVWIEDAMAARARAVLAGPLPAGLLEHLARETRRLYPVRPLDRPRELRRVVATLLLARRDLPIVPPPRVVHPALPGRAMAPSRWPVPPLATLGALAAWLGIDPGALDRLADVRGLERRSEIALARRYRYGVLPRADGRPRVLERPVAPLKAAQRRVLHGLLDGIPPHDAAHGFRRGRSAHTHAAVHAGRGMVIRLDLEDFFASVAAGRVYGILRTAGYPEAVAHVLTGLCTNVVPAAVWAAIPPPGAGGAAVAAVAAHWRLGRALAVPHLPQGAPTSPALANLAAFRLDRRLAGLAAAWGGAYSRYADDLVLSADALSVRGARRLAAAAAAIARDEGFRVHPGKTRVMAQATRQVVGGLVVNVRPAVARRDADALRALLHNLAVPGATPPDAAALARLTGRVAWAAASGGRRRAHLRVLLAAAGRAASEGHYTS
jgi:hypothetical protein